MFRLYRCDLRTTSLYTHTHMHIHTHNQVLSPGGEDTQTLASLASGNLVSNTWCYLLTFPDDARSGLNYDTPTLVDDKSVTIR